MANLVDVREEICSGPVLKVKVKLNQMEPNEVLEVLANFSSKDDITRIFGKILGHQIISVESHEKDFKILIKKKA